MGHSQAIPHKIDMACTTIGLCARRSAMSAGHRANTLTGEPERAKTLGAASGMEKTGGKLRSSRSQF